MIPMGPRPYIGKLGDTLKGAAAAMGTGALVEYFKRTQSSDESTDSTQW